MMIICLINQNRRPRHSRKARMQLFRTQIFAFLTNGYIVTTKNAAIMLKVGIDKLITMAKQNTLHAFRNVLSNVNNQQAAHMLFHKAQDIKDRNSGYTSICKLGNRKGDNALLYGLSWSEPIQNINEENKK